MQFKNLILLSVLFSTAFLTGCAETQFVMHTAKRINNYFSVPSDIENPSLYNETPLSRDDVIEIQNLLTNNGYDTGGIDGIVGPKTQKAVQSYQTSVDIAGDGTPSMALLEELRKNNSN